MLLAVEIAKLELQQIICVLKQDQAQQSRAVIESQLPVAEDRTILAHLGLEGLSTSI